MDRKKTILIAVMINAGLLAILFIAALTTQEEIVIAPVEHMAEAPLPLADPLFNEPLGMAPSLPLAVTEEALPLVQLPVLEKKEEPVLHKLPQIVKEQEVAVSQEGDRPFEVTVKKGDTLEKIAKAHNTTIDAILKMNALPTSFLRIGQVLKVPAQKTLASAPKLKPLAPQEKMAGPEYYTVKVGDNPWTIAMKHHMKVDELLRLNGLNEDRARKLKPGDRLRIR